MTQENISVRCASRRKLLPASLLAALMLPASLGAFARDTGQRQQLSSQIEPTRHTPIAVASCDDAGLRGAIGSAMSGDVLDLTTCSEITLTAGAIHVNADYLTLIGPGAGQLAIEGYYDRIFDHTGVGTLTVKGMTLTDGKYIGWSPGANVKGGCIYSAGSIQLVDAAVTGCIVESVAYDYALGGAVYARSDVTLDRTRVTMNTAYAPANDAEGGGVFARGDFKGTDSTIAGNKAIAPTGAARGGGVTVLGGGHVSIMRSTLSGNEAEVAGGAYIHTTGGIDVDDSTISSNHASRYVGGAAFIPGAIVANSTITGNSAAVPYFGVGVYADQLTIQSSIVANNLDDAHTTMSDVYALAIGGDLNLIMSASTTMPAHTVVDCPRLKPLQDNGGPTLTHELNAGSPAVDAGSNPLPLDTDQRGIGYARTVGAGTDIGAYEWQGEIDESIFKSAFEVPCDDY